MANKITDAASTDEDHRHLDSGIDNIDDNLRVQLSIQSTIQTQADELGYRQNGGCERLDEQPFNFERIGKSAVEAVEYTCRVQAEEIEEKTQSLIDEIDKTGETNLETLQNEGLCLLDDLKTCSFIERQKIKDLGSAVQGDPTLNQHALEEFKRDLVDFYYVKHSELPISPLIKQKSSKLLDFYVLPTMKRRLCNQMSGSNINAFENIDQIADILLDEDKPSQELTVVSARSGVGKTAFCKFIAIAWCTFYKVLDSSEESQYCRDIIRENLQFLNKTYDIVFYVNLNEVRNDGGDYFIENVIEKSIIRRLKGNYDRKILEAVMKMNCLILFDGLENWPYQDLPEFEKERPTCTLAFTARPWAISRFNLHDISDVNFVHMEGLNENSSGLFIDKLIQCLNEKYEGRKNPNDFVAILQGHRNADLVHGDPSDTSSVTSIPLIIMHLVCLWYDGQPLGESKCQTYCNMINLLFARSNKAKHATSSIKKKGHLPSCFDNCQSCLENMDAMFSLAELAFKALFAGNKENRYVFRGSFIPKKPKSFERLVLDIGIISKEVISPTAYGSQETYSFYHVSYQEMLCALHLATMNGDEFKHFLQNFRMDNFADALDFTEIFVFLCGMNDTRASLFAESFSDLINRMLPKSIFHDVDFVLCEKIKFVQDIICKGYDESVRNGTTKSELVLRHFSDSGKMSLDSAHYLIDKKNTISSLFLLQAQCNEKQIASVVKRNKHSLGFLYMYTGNSEADECVALKKVIKELKNSNLHTLRIARSVLSVELNLANLETFCIERSVFHALPFCSKLKHFSVDNCSMIQTNQRGLLHTDQRPSSQTLDLSKLANLQSLHINDLRLITESKKTPKGGNKEKTMWPNSRRSYSDSSHTSNAGKTLSRPLIVLPKQNEMKRLNVSSLSMPAHLDLSTYNLEYLTVKCCPDIVEMAVNAKYLFEIDISGDISLDITFAFTAKLEILRLRNVYILKTDVSGSGTLDLSRCHSLKEVSLTHVRFEGNFDVSRCPRLKKLKLDNVIFNGFVVGMNILEMVSCKVISQCNQVISEVTRSKPESLEECTLHCTELLNDASVPMLVGMLPSMINLKRLNLSNMRFPDVINKLSLPENVTSITFERISMSSSTLYALTSSVESVYQRQSINLTNCDITHIVNIYLRPEQQNAQRKSLQRTQSVRQDMTKEFTLSRSKMNVSDMYKLVSDLTKCVFPVKCIIDRCTVIPGEEVLPLNAIESKRYRTTPFSLTITNTDIENGRINSLFALLVLLPGSLHVQVRNCKVLGSDSHIRGSDLTNATVPSNTVKEVSIFEASLSDTFLISLIASSTNAVGKISLQIDSCKILPIEESEQSTRIETIQFRSKFPEDDSTRVSDYLCVTIVETIIPKDALYQVLMLLKNSYRDVQFVAKNCDIIPSIDVQSAITHLNETGKFEMECCDVVDN
ncbi:hypothetical protein MAR_038088 [Mya arenaria]|uniref:NACHT domain-containing protein n=1 Tax=Mya arenaria TaxID=6604 RepID=A0ABY7FT08_MYAAR|nr:uncharacterized protein LOC128213055 [Mya arenaria]WAR24419.1 hypothetical protein MAR_038088 [Mya arenaria]